MTGPRVLTEAEAELEMGRLRQLLEVLVDELPNIYGVDGVALRKNLNRTEALAAACLVYAQNIDGFFTEEVAK